LPALASSTSTTQPIELTDQFARLDVSNLNSIVQKVRAMHSIKPVPNDSKSSTYHYKSLIGLRAHAIQDILTTVTKAIEDVQVQDKVSFSEQEQDPQQTAVNKIAQLLGFKNEEEMTKVRNVLFNPTTLTTLQKQFDYLKFTIQGQNSPTDNSPSPIDNQYAYMMCRRPNNSEFSQVVIGDHIATDHFCSAYIDLFDKALGGQSITKLPITAKNRESAIPTTSL
jgi:hypothetical protein